MNRVVFYFSSCFWDTLRVGECFYPDDKIIKLRIGI